MIDHVPHETTSGPTVEGCFKVKNGDLMGVYHNLLSSGVAVLLPEELAVKDNHGRVITGGLFAVSHKETSDRVILDRRPFNQLERRLVWAKLPHGCLLTQLIVPPDYSVRGSGDDLSNYFYLLKHNENWLPRNAIGRVFDGEGFEKYGGEKGKKYLLSFCVVAMGDLNAVDIAQQVHVEILRDCHCMQPGEALAYKQVLPSSHCYEGLYIDDHVTVQILPKKSLRKAGDSFRDEEIIRDSRAYYAKNDIPTSAKKAFEKSDNFVAWGTEVDSRSGRVGTPIRKLRQLGKVLLEVLDLRKVSKKMLQQVTGLLVHPFMHRRSLMCLLQETFIWIETLGESESRPLPPAVREELLWCALCLPVAEANIRWEVSNRVGCSDASLTGGGRGATLTTEPIAQTLYRFAEHKGEHIRLDWESGGLAPDSSMQHVPVELEELLGDHPWVSTESVCCLSIQELQQSTVPWLTRLRWEKYSVAYRRRLVEAGRALCWFLRRRGIEWSDLAKVQANAIDELLAAFVQELNQTDSSASLRIAKHGVLFMQIWQPRLKKCLPTTWSHLLAWEELRPVSFRPPLPIAFLIAMMLEARLHSLKSENSEGEDWLVFSALIGIGFFGLLRPGEIFSLRACDISLPNDISLGCAAAVVRIRHPKNARQMGRQQYASVCHPDVTNWLVWAVKRCQSNQSYLWQGSQQKFRSFFRNCCKRLKIGHCKFSPASLRAGGATWYVGRSRSDIGKLRFEGRWSNLRALEHYVQTARSQQLLLQVADQTSERLSRFIQRHSFLLTLPQFLELKLPAQHLIPTCPLVIRLTENVSRACRQWGERGRIEEAVQEGDHRRWEFEGRTLH
eukprot:s2633_g2.t1